MWKTRAVFLIRNEINITSWDMLTVPCQVTISANINRQRDIDNILKLLLDALETARVFKNDNLIDKLVITRDRNIGNIGDCIVRVSSLSL